MRIPFLVPSQLALAMMACLLYLFGFSEKVVWFVGYVLAGYLIAMVSITMAPAGWFRMSVSLSHSFVFGYLLAAGLVTAYHGRGSLAPLSEMIALYPGTTLAIAGAIWLLEKGLRLSRFAGRLDRIA